MSPKKNKIILKYHNVFRFYYNQYNYFLNVFLTAKLKFDFLIGDIKTNLNWIYNYSVRLLRVFENAGMIFPYFVASDSLCDCQIFIATLYVLVCASVFFIILIMIFSFSNIMIWFYSPFTHFSWKFFEEREFQNPLTVSQASTIKFIANKISWMHI